MDEFLKKILQNEHSPSADALPRVMYEVRRIKQHRRGINISLYAAAALLLIAFFSGAAIRHFFFPGKDTSYQEVVFTYNNAEAAHVAVTGDFTGWEPVSFTHRPDGGWETILRIKKNGRYRYVFIIDHEEFIPDPNQHSTVNDGFGMRNSVLTL